MSADVFVVAQLSDRTNDKGERLMNILTLTDKAGHQTVPFFTSPARLSVLANENRKTFNVMKLNTVKLFQSVKGKSAVLNPNSPAVKNTSADIRSGSTFFHFALSLLASMIRSSSPQFPRGKGVHSV